MTISDAIALIWDLWVPYDHWRTWIDISKDFCRLSTSCQNLAERDIRIAVCSMTIDATGDFCAAVYEDFSIATQELMVLAWRKPFKLQVTIQRRTMVSMIVKRWKKVSDLPGSNKFLLQTEIRSVCYCLHSVLPWNKLPVAVRREYESPEMHTYRIVLALCKSKIRSLCRLSMIFFGKYCFPDPSICVPFWTYNILSRGLGPLALCVVSLQSQTAFTLVCKVSFRG